MSFMCIVCRDPLTTFPEAEIINIGGKGRDEPPPMLVTRCGHTYHQFCLKKWLESKQDITEKVCPFCKIATDLSLCTKIFAVGDEDFDDDHSEMTARSQEISNLRVEHIQVHDHLNNAQEQLEKEQLAHEILKTEYACKLSEIIHLTNELESTKSIIETLTQDIKNVEEDNLNIKRTNDASCLELISLKEQVNHCNSNENKAYEFLNSMQEIFDNFLNNKVKKSEFAATNLNDAINSSMNNGHGIVNGDESVRNGTFMWKISEFGAKMEEAKSKKNSFLTSEPFYTSQYGYKLLRCNNVRRFTPSPESRIFQRQSKEPKIDDGEGYDKFISHENLYTRNYIKDDSILLKINVESIMIPTSL